MMRDRYFGLLNTPEHLRDEARRWGKLGSQAPEAAAATAHHRHLRRNAERAGKAASKRPTSSNLNLSASMATLTAQSAKTLAEVLDRTQDVADLPPANVITFLGPKGWHAEALVHAGEGFGEPVLRVEGADNENEAKSELRRLAKHHNVAEPSAQSDY